MGIITKGMGVILKGGKKKKTLTLGKGQTELQKIKLKHQNAHEKMRIEGSGEGQKGELVTPKQDLAEDYEILRDKINRGKK